MRCRGFVLVQGTITINLYPMTLNICVLLLTKVNSSCMIGVMTCMKVCWFLIVKNQKPFCEEVGLGDIFALGPLIGPCHQKVIYR